MLCHVGGVGMNTTHYAGRAVIDRLYFTITS